METKHTPGPWKAVAGLGRWNVTTSDAPRTLNICPINTDRVEQEANARLIAAAPDLLASLREFVELAREHREACKASGERPIIDAGRLTRGLAAIAKATAAS